MPPPNDLAVLSLSVESIIVQKPSFEMAPPKFAAFSVNVDPTTKQVAPDSLQMPPPLLLDPFPLNNDDITINFPAFKTPPPLPEICPSTILTECMATVAPLTMLKTRLASLPETVTGPDRLDASMKRPLAVAGISS